MRDPLRPYVSLQSSGPFRVRSNGQLYVVASGSPVTLDLRSSAAIEARSVTGEWTLTVTYSAKQGAP